MVQAFRLNIKIILFALVATLFVGIAYTSADFFTSPTHGLSDKITLLFQWAIIIFGIFPVFYLLSLNKYLFAVSFPLICLFSCVLTYFRYTTGTIFTTMIFDAALDNDTKINQELISVWLILTIIISVLIALLFVVYRFKKIQRIPYVFLHILFAATWITLVFQIPRIIRPMTERIPMNLYFIPKRYFSEEREVLTERPPFSCQIYCPDEKPIMVLIIGEALRAGHLGINGYSRNTTPLLSNEDVVSFPNIYSEYTYTHPSVAHILTRADSINPELANKERSFIDLFKQCGYYTAWLANQEPAKSYIYFMQECDTLIYGNINKSYYVFDKWTDDLLLEPFDSIMKNAEDSRLVILHTIGSHWYYNSHYTDEFQKFNPITGSRIVSSNTAEEMINSYDNTVLYTDYFITQVIERLRDKNAVMIYLSDHGEALGENGFWLHANEVEEAHNPACIVWFSEKYKKENTEKYNTLHSNKKKHFRTDFLFHTILESANIKSDVLRREMSLFYE
jgi:glucan phosphoethanolaminetransferase (alkaline phosphatase superfamily)